MSTVWTWLSEQVGAYLCHGSPFANHKHDPHLHVAFEGANVNTALGKLIFK